MECDAVCVEQYSEASLESSVECDAVSVEQCREGHWSQLWMVMRCVEQCGEVSLLVCLWESLFKPLFFKVKFTCCYSKVCRLCLTALLSVQVFWKILSNLKSQIRISVSKKSLVKDH